MDSIINILILAGSLGLLSNLHCIGMCGPISLALPLNRKNSWTASAGVTLYTLGRSLGYASLGVVIGIIGISANLFGVLQWLSIISGILIILFAWSSYYNRIPQLKWLNNWISKSMSRIFKNKNEKGKNYRLFSFGVVNAFLPCGMVYVALLSAMNVGSIKHAALFMAIFGVATLPGFLVLALVKTRIGHWNFLSKKVIVASLVSLVGIAIILRGMNLGIPYISPKMEITKNEESSEETATMSCCSKTDNGKKDECKE